MNNKILTLQEIMVNENIHATIIPTDDYHLSEYVCDYFKGRAYLSGFTGSAGVLLVLQNEALLWTDGRYFIQAEKQLYSNVKLMRMGDDKVPSLDEYLLSKLNRNEMVAVDGRVFNFDYITKLKEKLSKASILFNSTCDLVSRVWDNRPKLPCGKAFLLDEPFSGKKSSDKLKKIRKQMQMYHANIHIVTQLDDIAWILNVRANDLPYSPVLISYLVITLDKVILFVDKNKLGDLLLEEDFKENNVLIKPYNAIYDYCDSLKKEDIVLIDTKRVNYTICHKVIEKANLIDKTNYSFLAKAIKNPTEIENTKIAHINDGIAFTKFMHYIKNNVNKHTITELDASNYITKERKMQDGFIDLSFNPIVAYNANAAMMHYSANENSNAVLKDEGLLLVDSGGHYLYGSTDITRTIALGPVSDDMKLHYTTVLKSLINLSQAIFLKGCSGQNLDILARGPIWKLLIDYKCGTGHGIGHILNVHEGPNGFRYKIVPERNDSAPFEEGMITTNEPGIYLEGQYGIRLENELLCVFKSQNEYGVFLGFETITIAPFDKDLIDVELLTKDEINWINDYHARVYNTLKDSLTAKEASWLETYTKAL